MVQHSLSVVQHSLAVVWGVPAGLTIADILNPLDHPPDPIDDPLGCHSSLLVLEVATVLETVFEAAVDPWPVKEFQPFKLT